MQLFIAHHIRRFSSEDVKTTREGAPRSFGAAQEVLGKRDLREDGDYSTTASEVLEDLRLLGYIELEGLLDPGPQDT